jgi:NAD-dependent SIR2 family protein deacetylase
MARQLVDFAAVQRIVILTGAGLSAESGIATFRDKGGIWSTVRIEDVATPEAFVRDPARVHEFAPCPASAPLLSTIPALTNRSGDAW